MKYEILATTRFKKDLKTVIKRGYDIQSLQNLISLLASGRILPEKNKDHPLSGNWIGFRVCHINPGWLLVYKIDNSILILTLTRTGTHSDLF